MNKIDMHTHILPKNIPDFKSQFGYGGFIRLEEVPNSPGFRDMYSDTGKFFRRVEPNCFERESRLEDMRRTGVTRQVLSTVPVMFSYWAKDKDGLAVSEFLNNDMAEFIAEDPKRFIGLGTLPMQNVELAIKEARRLKEDLGFPGVQIGSHIEEKNLCDKSFFPLWEALQDMNMAVLVHPWDMMGKEKMPKYWLPWLVGMPAESSLAACSLIFGGVLETFPDLRFCIAHAGGSFLFTLGRIEHGFNVRPDLCAVDNDKAPSQYVKQLYFDTITHDPKAFQYLMDLADPEKLLLGSDYPFPLGEEHPGGMISDLNLHEKLVGGFFEKNTLAWLGMGS